MGIQRHPVSVPGGCSACPIRAATLYGGAPELAARIDRLRTGIRTFDARRTICREGEPVQELFTLFDGWAMRFKMLPDGRRQNLAVLLPGDAISLSGLWSERQEFSVQALTPVSLCVFDRATLREFVRSQPDLEWRIGGLMAREIGQLEERLTYLGKCTAHERVARLIINIHKRLAARKLVDGPVFDFPLRQQHIGDSLGLTAVHVSRVLRELRDAGLIERRDRKLAILNYEGLEAIARGGGETAGRRSL